MRGRTGAARIRFAATGVVAWTLFLACAGLPDFDERGSWPTPTSGMVVSEHPLATSAGVEILERGGNAADAAVATALALAVVYPQAGSLGGGGFALWVAHDPLEEPLFLDYRETAPAGLRAEMFLDEGGQRDPVLALESGLSVGVPGVAHGLHTFHEKLGRLSFEQVVAPAIRLARSGFVVDPQLAEELALVESKLARHPGARALFGAGATLLSEGQLLRQDELAATLEAYARSGPRAFYEGTVAAALVQEVRDAGGVLTAADLAGYRSAWRPPLRGWFRGLEIVSAPPPSSGGVALLQALSMLDGFPLDEERVRVLAEDPSNTVGLSPRALHWWIETMRLAFADRAQFLGDPDFVDVPVEALLSPERITSLRIAIGELANPGVAAAPVAAFREGGETTHLSVLDRFGNAVSLTTTLNTNLGSGIVVRGTGILLNDEMDDFAFAPGQPNTYGLVGGRANALEPGKRPLSSMTPTVVRDGGQVVRLVLGSPGGPKIITSVLEVLLRVVVYGQELPAAVAAPRVHQQWSPSETAVEPGWNELLLQGLRDRSHTLVEKKAWGSVQAIAVEPGGTPVGASDPRSSGSAGGP
jgi:gamma-glutamyltranspeptidase/glutathione hydrolase